MLSLQAHLEDVWTISLSLTLFNSKSIRFFFTFQRKQLVATQGFLSFERVTLYVRHHSMVSHDTLQCSIKLANECCSLLFYVKMTSNSNKTAASAAYTPIFLAADIMYSQLRLLLGLGLWLLREGKLYTAAFQGGSSCTASQLYSVE